MINLTGHPYISILNVQCDTNSAGMMCEIFVANCITDNYLHAGQARLVLPEERTTGLGCVPVGRTVSYQCIITDPNPPTGITIWSGSCQISLQHSTFFEQGTETCGIGIFSAMALYVNGSNYVSQLTFNASIELNGTTVSCSLSLTTQISSDVLKIGGLYANFTPAAT